MRRETKNTLRSISKVNRTLSLKFLKALKKAEQDKTFNWDGKVFDKEKGCFVDASQIADPMARKKAIDSQFFMKNGSFYTKMDAEIDLFKKSLARKQYEGVDSRNKKQMSSLFCSDSKNQKEHDFIMPGAFSSSGVSPMKFIPKRPSAANHHGQGNSGPDLAMIGPGGQILNETASIQR